MKALFISLCLLATAYVSLSANAGIGDDLTQWQMVGGGTQSLGGNSVTATCSARQTNGVWEETAYASSGSTSGAGTTAMVQFGDEPAYNDSGVWWSFEERSHALPAPLTWRAQASAGPLTMGAACAWNHS